MKLKTVEVGGKMYAEVQDGKPVFLHDDGKEVAFDAATTVATISRLNGEAKGHREAKEAAEAKLKQFEGIADPEAARKAMEIAANLDAGQLVTAGKVEEIKAAAKKAAEEQVAAAAKQNAERLKELETKAGKLESDLYGEKVGGAFGRSKFVTEKAAVPADMAIAVPNTADSSDERIGFSAVRASATIKLLVDSPKTKRKLLSVGFFGHHVRSAPVADHSAIGLKAIDTIHRIGTSVTAIAARIAA